MSTIKNTSLHEPFVYFCNLLIEIKKDSVIFEYFMHVMQNKLWISGTEFLCNRSLRFWTRHGKSITNWYLNVADSGNVYQ